MAEDTITAEDPITGDEIEIPADVEVGEIIDSPITGAELEVVSVDPVVLEEAPELEEDWGSKAMYVGADRRSNAGTLLPSRSRETSRRDRL